MSWVLAAKPEQDGALWLGTTREGLFKLDLMSQRFVQYFGGNNVSRIVRTRLGDLYVQVGLHLYVYDQETDSFSGVFEEELFLCGETRDGSLWFGTRGSRVHLARYDPSRGSIQHFPRTEPDSGIIHDAYPFPLYEDQDGILWFGTYGGGMSRFDPRTGQYRRYTAQPEVEGTLVNNSVKAVVEDEAGTLWIGTDGGLHSFDRASERFTLHPTRLGDRDLAIKGLVADARGNLWMACAYRLVCFMKASGNFLWFGGKQGLKGDQYQSIDFNKEDGRIYVGEWERAFSFNPDSLVALSTSVSPKVLLTGFDIFDKPARLPAAISMTEEIVLPYSDNFFSFKFAVLDFVDPTWNRYAYKLEGFDREWQYPFDRRVAYYTNVDPGEYIFRVKGSNSLGVWNDEGASVRLIVTPPWWKTIWAYIGYGVAIILVLYGMRRYDRKRTLLKHELKLKDFEAEKLREIDGMKMRFFANISHEFRTPLTLILGPVEKLLSRVVRDDDQEELNIVRRNGLRLLELINQLLDISKLDAGRMKNQVQTLDLIPYLKGLVFSFASLAERKHIALKFEPAEGTITAHVDRDKLQKIITNLLSNAFKFTPDGGEVRVGVSIVEGAIEGGLEQVHPEATKGFAEILVADTGVGIPMERLEKIFHRFYQVDDSHVREHEGTGIGLALAKELVEVHHGHITVTSEPGKGSTFRVRLPLGKEHWKEEEVVEEAESAEGRPGAVALPPQEVSAVEERVEEKREREEGEGEDVLDESSGDSRSLVLIVEDNADVRSYIQAFLTREYRVEEAEDGTAGLEAAMDHTPDLVVSDIMMPKMDGVELCRRLKTDERTSHIPVILLTARASGEGKLEGLETGADDYIIKPFDMKELQVRIKNLIELRKTLREKYRRQCVLEPGDVPIESMEEKFLRKALDVVQEQMTEPGFNTATLARGVCMSRMQLNRKLQALTGRSPHEFIRNLRMQRAAKLLEAHWGNVAEVAFEVGFNSLSHFAKAFREEYGVLPSEYGANHAQGAHR
jgi:signal transduction histidine kinase/DNA-binding response OmpR family regulator